MTVLDGVDVTVGPDTRLGVVGPNGVGKTTLLRILAGIDVPDRGSIRRSPPDLRVGYLPQEASDREPGIRARSDAGRERPGVGSAERGKHEVARVDRLTVLDDLAWRSGVREAEDDLARAAAALSTNERGAEDWYSNALDDYLALGGPDFEVRAREVWSDLGLAEALLDGPAAALSGGEAARLSLAALLVSRFDVFLLDEPTNDLDFGGLARLEQFLAAIDGGFVVVSHDRAFLARTVERVLEIDEHTRRGTEFGGGWAARSEERRVGKECRSRWSPYH